jgi:hypothetical protein
MYFRLLKNRNQNMETVLYTVQEKIFSNQDPDLALISDADSDLAYGEKIVDFVLKKIRISSVKI